MTHKLWSLYYLFFALIQIPFLENHFNLMVFTVGITVAVLSFFDCLNKKEK